MMEDEPDPVVPFEDDQYDEYVEAGILPSDPAEMQEILEGVGEVMREVRKEERRPRRRGDNIPPVSDYAHWNEDAYSMWYEENKYDMEHADEIIEEEDDFRDYEDEEED